MITASQVEENINAPDFYHSPLTTLVCLENTTNKGGGACYELETIQEIREVCDRHELGLHLDGARLFNAFAEKDYTPKDFGKVFDTISVCLSKGLGTPMGSVLIGKKSLMKNAIRVRKVLGGGMRQVGFMAAAGIYALDNHLEQLKKDNDRALELSELLSKQPYVKSLEPTETNIIIFYLKDDVKELEFMQKLDEKNIRISNMGQGKLRIVTHHDYTEEMHQFFKETLQKIRF